MRTQNQVRYIAIAGNMGSGKSSLVKFLCKQFDASPFFEPNDRNPYLEDFYQDMNRWAFNSQMYFLVHKFRIHRKLEGSEGAVIQDRTIYEDAEIFAECLKNRRCFDRRDWRAYRELYETLVQELQPPDLMIYLRCSVRNLQKRIKMRGRSSEATIPTPYLQTLNRLYERWFANYTRSPSVVIETDRMDYITDLFDRHELLSTFGKYLRERTATPLRAAS